MARLAQIAERDAPLALEGGHDGLVLDRLIAGEPGGVRAHVEQALHVGLLPQGQIPGRDSAGEGGVAALVLGRARPGRVLVPYQHAGHARLDEAGRLAGFLGTDAAQVGQAIDRRLVGELAQLGLGRAISSRALP